MICYSFEVNKKNKKKKELQKVHFKGSFTHKKTEEGQIPCNVLPHYVITKLDIAMEEKCDINLLAEVDSLDANVFYFS